MASVTAGWLSEKTPNVLDFSACKVEQPTERNGGE